MQSAIDRTQRPLKVFVIDDSRLVRDFLIEEIGCIRETEFVGSAETQSEAVEKLGRLECDAIVLDINLAQGNGFEVLKAVRASHVHRPKVIIFTSYAYPFYRQLTMELGANYFLDKATDFKRLLEIIELLTAKHGAEPN